ncbi:polymer-forming cytoskeletal protein [Desulfobacter sp.]|uniref:bactofilin family protein n=1 Tax=Desulfobacter sp. TaxID=2294 RepID=UPI000E95E29F|nr:polymer-forming cytoskeletal protein [Desulfobacter sp.]HBT89155.1 polymer-forming cytoskeletal protein [Desulfobacter sp.]
MRKNTKNLSIIDKELKIDGSIESCGKLIIKGQVKGTINGDVVIIAQDGEVNSNLTKVSSLTIGGSFKGELIASNELIILATGSCAGKVVCQDLIVENGGVLNADISCKTSSKMEPVKKEKSFFSRGSNQKEEKQIEL